MSSDDRDSWLTPERYRRLQDLADAAERCSPAEIGPFLDAAVGADTRLRTELLALVDARRVLPAGVDIGPGTAIGPYEIEREIGHGGMGTVYLAHRADEAYQRLVAIKVMRADASGEEFLARFALERRILATLDHPNVARLLDGGTFGDDRPYLVMEYVDGVPLPAHADRSRLSTTERVRLLQVVCGAVEHAHQQLVVHRDLKPANILVTPEGQPKLLDFGIARILRPLTHDTGRLTTSRGRPGTPRYASPEQRAGASVGTSTDVYALGVVAYELLAGMTPCALSGGAVSPPSRALDLPGAAAVAAARGTTISSLRRQLSGDLDAIVLKAISPAVADRYRSATELNQDLARHLNRIPVTARRPTVSYRTTRFLARNRVGTTVTAALAVSLTAGMTGTYAQWQRAEFERGRAEHRFNNLRSLAASVLDISAGLGDTDDGGRARDALVATSLRYLEQLEREADGDRGLLRELAAAYRRVGDVQREVERSAGRPQAAGASLTSYRRALRVSEDLAQTSAGRPDARRDLALSLDRVGGTLVEVGETREGTDALARALRLYRELLAADHSSVLAQRDLAYAHVRFADAVAPTDPESARRSYAEAHSLVRRLSVRTDLAASFQADVAALESRLRTPVADRAGLADEQDIYFEAIRDSTDPARLAYFLERFPDSPHAAAVRARLDALLDGRRSPASTAPAVNRDRHSVAVPIEWREIPSGTFEMGCDLRRDPWCDADERPRRRVALSRRFELAATETTLGQYRQYARATRQTVPTQPVWNTSDRQPVVNITWAQATAFCAAVGGRLPTEAEWERAARGNHDWLYPWGDTYDRTRANAGFPGRDGWDTASPAGTFPANEFGLFDMAGNVWEWVSDWYGSTTYMVGAARDPSGPGHGPGHVIRGGAYNTPPRSLRVTQRGRDTMDRRREATGFRCAR